MKPLQNECEVMDNMFQGDEDLCPFHFYIGKIFLVLIINRRKTICYIIVVVTSSDKVVHQTNDSTCCNRFTTPEVLLMVGEEIVMISEAEYSDKGATIVK
jgi:hypothetical protein